LVLLTRDSLPIQTKDNPEMTEVSNIFTCTPRQIRRHAERVLQAGRVPFVKSSPGLGKSSIMKQIADDWNLQLIDFRLSTAAPEDMTGLPRFMEDGTCRFFPFSDLFPIEGTPLPEGKDGWLLFLDEMNSAPKSVEAAAYKLVLDRKTGVFPLHERVLIAAAGNLSSDKAIVNNQSTAMKSRLVHLRMEPSFKEWLEDVAYTNGYDERIIAFLNYRPSYLMDFDPDSKDETFCCPRTWEFVNDLLGAMGSLNDEDASLLAGTITSGVAVEFVQFTKVYDSMVSIKDIIADPKGVKVPTDNATRFAVVSHMMENANKSNFADLVTYIERFDYTFQVLFFKSVMKRQPMLQSDPAFTSSMVRLSKYIHD
jgi:hypothetical protein